MTVIHFSATIMKNTDLRPFAGAMAFDPAKPKAWKSTQPSPQAMIVAEAMPFDPANPGAWKSSQPPPQVKVVAEAMAFDPANPGAWKSLQEKPVVGPEGLNAADDPVYDEGASYYSCEECQKTNHECAMFAGTCYECIAKFEEQYQRSWSEAPEDVQQEAEAAFLTREHSPEASPKASPEARSPCHEEAPKRRAMLPSNVLTKKLIEKLGRKGLMMFSKLRLAVRRRAAAERKKSPLRKMPTGRHRANRCRHRTKRSAASRKRFTRVQQPRYRAHNHQSLRSRLKRSQ